MPRKKGNYGETCGFCGKPAQHRGAGLVYPVPGSDDITESKHACAKCRKEKTDELIALGHVIPVDPAGLEVLADVEPPKRKQRKAKDIPLHERLLKLIQEEPLTDKDALTKVKPKSDIRKIQQGFYRLRRDGTAIKKNAEWHVTAKGMKA